MEINPGLAAEAPAHASSPSVVNPFDWIEPLDSINTTSGNGGEVSFSAISEYSGERYQQSPRPLRSLLNTHHDEFTATTERKRELQSLCQGAPLRRKKKPKSLPKRPLSAYNLYFQRVRADLNSDGGSRIGFHELGKIVGKKWKSLSEEEHKVYRELADQDSARYRRDMEQHNKIESQKKDERNAEQSLRKEESIPPDRSGVTLPAYGEIPAPKNFGPPLSPSFGNSSQFPSSDYPSYPPPPQPMYAQTWGNNGSAPTHYRRPDYHGYDSPQSAVVVEGMPKNGKPLTPGSEVHVRDEAGELRAYTVHYAMVTMSRDEAKDYVDRLKCNS